jgi:hypothetical protein
MAASQGFTPIEALCEKRRKSNCHGEKNVKPEEIKKLEAYFKRTFNQGMVIKARPKKDESAEVYLGDEFLGVIFRDEEDGELSYSFSMAILDIDL